jgi:FAD/FMN-containing dehydrogenase
MQHSQVKNIMALPEAQTTLSNWSKTGHSPCYHIAARDVADIQEALAVARAQQLTVIPHGAGHSYTDAALNTGGIVLDLTPMNRILAWDAGQGIMRVEPGVTLRDMLRASWKDGWWPFATPSTPEVTIGGCVAMNVMGKNAWKDGAFGDHVLALDVLLASGETMTLTPQGDAQLFRAFVGGVGLLGVITAITMQLQRLPSGRVTIQRRAAASLAGIFTLFSELRQESDFIEAWLDGFAEGGQLGRGHVTAATMTHTAGKPQFRFPSPGLRDQLAVSFTRRFGGLYRPLFLTSIPIANHIKYWQGRWEGRKPQQRSLLPYTYYSPAAFAGYHVMLPQGVETFQAFVSGQQAQTDFADVLRYSQQHGYTPIWCIIKQHRRDPSLLSYQLDGFSLELNYPRTARRSRGGKTLEDVLRQMIEMVVAAGGRFYLAKDHFMTAEQYRRSIGAETVDTFLDLKRRYDPEAVFQSDLFQRLFQPAPQQQGG